MEAYGIKKIGEQRYREDPGRSYEDFVVGDVYEHWPGRTVTETDNVWFTNLTMNTHPVHFDSNYASKTEFGRCLVNSTLTLGAWWRGWRLVGLRRRLWPIWGGRK